MPRGLPPRIYFKKYTANQYGVTTSICTREKVNPDAEYVWLPKYVKVHSFVLNLNDTNIVT